MWIYKIQDSTLLKPQRTPYVYLSTNLPIFIYWCFPFMIDKPSSPFVFSHDRGHHLFNPLVDFKLHDTQYCSKKDIDKYLPKFFVDLILPHTCSYWVLVFLLYKINSLYYAGYIPTYPIFPNLNDNTNIMLHHSLFIKLKKYN